MEIDYLVEADTATLHLIWLLLNDTTEWEENPRGYVNIGIFMGKTEKDPNMLSLTHCKINDKVVCFYWGTSQKVNHQEIDEYLDEKFPNTSNLSADSLVYTFKDFT